VPNLFWYYGVTIIGLGMFVFTIFKKNNTPMISLVFFLTISLLTVGEFFILIVFDAYAYKPEVFTDIFADSLVGHLLGNLFLWAGAANLVVNFSLGNRWIFLLSGIFMLIETLFLRLGIYEHHWWQTYFTGIAVILSMNIKKYWVSKLDEKPYKFLRYMTFYLFALVFIHVPTHLLLLTGKQHYSFGQIENFYRNSILFGLPYHAGMAFIYVFFCCVLRKKFWQLAPILFFGVSDFILVNMNILIFQDHWNFFYLTIFRTISLAIFVLFKNYACTALDQH
jgi:MFS family permease